MAVGFARLRLAPDAFWAMTPREFAAALRVLSGEPVGRFERSRLAELMARFPDAQRS